jgi:hypothetical protein
MCLTSLDAPGGRRLQDAGKGAGCQRMLTDGNGIMLLLNKDLC